MAKNPDFTVQQVDIGFDSRGKPISESKFLAELVKEANDGEKLRKALIFAWKHFGPFVGHFLFNDKGLISRSSSLEASKSSLELPPSDMVFLTFVAIAEHSYAGKFEKVAWSVAFTYKSIPFAFSLQKFGLKLYHHKDFSPPEALPKEMLRALSRAMKIVAKLCQPLVNEQIRSGNVTIANSFLQLDKMYRYFRGQAEENFAPKPKPAEPRLEGVAASLTELWRRRDAANYNASAMIDAYFSRLEHLLILILPFMNYDRTKHDLVRLMGAVWSEKFKAVFNLSTNPTARSLYERLVALRERNRNPISHGNFQKNGKSLYFHFPAGAISCQLSSTVAEQSNSITKLNESEFKELCAFFDEVDAFFETGPAEYGYQYAMSGLDVAFDENSLDGYMNAAQNHESLKDFINYQSEINAINMNMDW
jgi:hypothetical protein